LAHSRSNRMAHLRHTCAKVDRGVKGAFIAPRCGLWQSMAARFVTGKNENLRADDSHSQQNWRRPLAVEEGIAELIARSVHFCDLMLLNHGLERARHCDLPLSSRRSILHLYHPQINGTQARIRGNTSTSRAHAAPAVAKEVRRYEDFVTELTRGIGLTASLTADHPSLDRYTDKYLVCRPHRCAGSVPHRNPWTEIYRSRSSQKPVSGQLSQ
jgi:hypothetical protein